MPLRKEIQQFYGEEWQTVTRPRILARANNRCELCGVPNHERVLRAAGWWIKRTDARLEDFGGVGGTVSAYWHPPALREPLDRLGFPAMICREVFIVLTVMHLNHVSGDDRDENLKAACQWCHLTYDQNHHRETRSIRKDAQRPLLVGRTTSEGSEKPTEANI